MKTRTSYRKPFWSTLAVVASLFLALLIAVPGAEANTGAGATILNTVTIGYKDASGTNSFSANATTSVTVNLVEAALTISGRPTGGAATPSLPANQTVDSGATATYWIALTANANGNDTYDLSMPIGTVTNMASDSVNYYTYDNTRATVLATNPGTVTLGASVIVSSTLTTISIPGGSLATAGIVANSSSKKVLVVNGVDYIVQSVTSGNAPSNGHIGNTYYNSTGTATAETLDVITLAANPGGSNVAPNFTSSMSGQLAREQILVKVDVTGVITGTVGATGTVPFTVTTDAGGSSSNNPATSAAITTTFNPSNLQVRKTVANCGTSGTCGSYGATATGAPGDILEYKVEVNNPSSGGAAKLVTAADAVPTYTQLVCGSGVLGTTVCSSPTGTEIIATISDGTKTINITYATTNDECADGTNPNVGAGGAGGYAAGSALNFYLGNTCNGTTHTGGTISSNSTYTITYRVKMN